MAAKSYLVTGAAGFIGAAIARCLLQERSEVWTIDNLSTGFAESIPAGVKFIQGNCQDAEVIARLGDKRFDAILHIAGQSSGEISFDDPSYDLRTNTEATLRLIKFGLEHGCSRFIYASTMSVYARMRGLQRRIITLPGLPVSILANLVGRLTPVPATGSHEVPSSNR